MKVKSPPIRRSMKSGIRAASPGKISHRVSSSEAFDYLDAPIRRLTGLDIPFPYNRNLEYHTVPQVGNILQEARKIIQGKY